MANEIIEIVKAEFQRDETNYSYSTKKTLQTPNTAFFWLFSILLTVFLYFL